MTFTRVRRERSPPPPGTYSGISNRKQYIPGEYLLSVDEVRRREDWEINRCCSSPRNISGSAAFRSERRARVLLISSPPRSPPKTPCVRSRQLANRFDWRRWRERTADRARNNNFQFSKSNERDVPGARRVYAPQHRLSERLITRESNTRRKTPRDFVIIFFTPIQRDDRDVVSRWNFGRNDRFSPPSPQLAF